MSAANKKFQQLGRQVHAWKAKDHQKDKEIEIRDKFPYCRGTFEACPTEEEMKSALEEKIAPDICSKCPVYDDSGRPLPTKRKFVPQDPELYKRIFGKE